jgi:hypothetical protein
MSRTPLMTFLGLTIVFIGLAQTCRADAIEDAWKSGDLVIAEQLVLSALQTDPDNPDLLAWFARLDSNPQNVNQDLLSANEKAALAWTRGDLDAMADVLEVEDGTSHNDFLSGLLARRRGDHESARLSLASVQPDNPNFAWARYFLARIAMQNGKPALARRYLETAEQAPSSTCKADILAMQWELARVDDKDAAQRLDRELAHRFPNSLALTRVRDIQRHDQELAGGITIEEPLAIDSKPEEKSGRYTLQLGAYSDRGRAMTYRDAWADVLPDLTIAQSHDQRGRMLYKVRTGRYPSRSQATAAAEQLRRNHDLKALIVEISSSP